MTRHFNERPPFTHVPHDPCQLELALELPELARELTLEQARAMVPPGWWAPLTALWSMARVSLCREVDGRLEIAASALENDEEAHVQEQLALVRSIAAESCACCGYRRSPRRLTWDGRAHVACDRCWTLLKAGRTILNVADQFFALDGSRRPLPRVVEQGDTKAGPPASSLRSCTIMPPDELRAVAAEFRRELAARVSGQELAVGRIATLAALHVGGGTPGARALVVGPSGVGKTTLVSALEAALHQGKWDVPVIRVECIELQSPGWAGAPSIGDVIAGALGDTPADSPRARRAVVILDELHHIRAVDTAGGASPTSIGAKRAEILASLLGLTARDGVVNVGKDTYRPWSSAEAMVLALGAFTDLLDLKRDPTVADLARAGIGPELSSRFEQVIRLEPLSEPALVDLLQRWPALVALQAVASRLGLGTRIHEEAYRRAARVVTKGHDRSTPRTAGGWLVAALQAALDRALLDETVRELVVTPDDLPIRSDAFRPQRNQPPDEPTGGWDTTIILTPR